MENDELARLACHLCHFWEGRGLVRKGRETARLRVSFLFFVDDGGFGGCFGCAEFAWLY